MCLLLALHTRAQNTLPTTRTMNMTFVGYEEGDNPHLLFSDDATGEQIDFGGADNDLKSIPLLVEDTNAAFGFRANTPYVGRHFIVKAVSTRTRINYGEEVMEVQGWRITSIAPRN